jgi:RHS repeat-associated protein
MTRLPTRRAGAVAAASSARALWRASAATGWGASDRILKKQRPKTGMNMLQTRNHMPLGGSKRPIFSALGALLALLCCLPVPAAAQNASVQETPVLGPKPDPNGVDLVLGTYATASPFKVEAPAARNMSVRFFFNGRRITHSLNVWLEDRAYGGPPGETGGRYVTLHLGGVEKLYFCYGTTPCSDVYRPDGGVLSRNTSDVYTYRDRSGTVYQFFAPYSTVVPCYTAEDNCDTYQLDAAASTITYADGEKLTFGAQPTFTPSGSAWIWTDTVTSNLGYSIAFSSTTTNSNIGQAGTSWLSRIDTPSTATLTRGSAVLAKAAVQRTFSGANNASQTITQQDLLNRNYQLFLSSNPTSHCWGVDYASHQPVKEISPGNVVTDIGYASYQTGTYTTESRVSSVTRGGKTWSYAWTVGPASATALITDPTSASRTVTGVESSVAMSPNSGCEASPPSEGHPTQSIDGLSRSTAYAYGNDYRLTGATLPAGNGLSYQYDDRGNLIRASRCADSACGTSQVVYQAGYDAVCSNTATCNKPNWVKDGNGNQTDYTYDPVHGGVLTATLPADSSGVRPQTRYTYTPFDTGNGVLYRLTRTSECVSGSACSGTAAETVTTTTYWGTTFLPATVTRAAGDGSVSTSTTHSYDDAGRPIQITDTRGNSSYKRYDAVGRLVGEIEPPASDGIRRAKRFSYDDDDRVVNHDTGTVGGPSDADWSAFVLLERVTTSYDLVGQKVQETRTDGLGAVQSVTQFSYDPAGRLECTAVRMNPAAFGSLPASACTLGATGTQGADRITRNVYDQAGQLTQVREAVGVLGLEQAHATYSYTANGKREYVIDANGNRARLSYDSYDRETGWNFPSTAAPAAFNPATPASALQTAGSYSTTDYEAYGYDGADNRTSLRKRDGVTLTYGYDALNRMVLKTVPASVSMAAGYTVYYGYDLRGLQTQARFGSASGPGLTHTYDALGRLASTTTTMDGVSRTLSSQYDPDGNRTALNGNDGYHAGWDYDAADEVTYVRNSAGTAIVQLGNTPRGQRAFRRVVPSLSSATTYGYDSAGRLNSLVLDLAGSSADQSYGFLYNPANQIVSRTSSNDAYASNTAYNVSRPYSVNGLNQYVAAGGAAFTYDANGNLTSDGTSSYVYDAENRLVSRSGGVTLAYDPDGRLWQVSAPSGTTRFLYDGEKLIEEMSGTGQLQRSYIHGPGVDEPLVWSQFVGTVANYYLHPDHQGSIVAVADESGNPLAVNGYDAWGIPNAANQGRFGYTGQAWLPELGMWYYKARIYSPTLGRFLQTDPVGYKADINLYAYVDDDPVNKEDPTGECPSCAIGFVIEAVGQATSAKDRAAWSQAWHQVRSGNYRAALGSIKSQAARLAISTVSGGVGGKVGAFILTKGIASNGARVALMALNGSLNSAAQQAASNVASGEHAGKGVLGAALTGGLAAGLGGHLGRAKADRVLGLGAGHRVAEHTATRVEAATQSAVRVCQSASENSGICH